jgi:hypothetical protein
VAPSFAAAKHKPPQRPAPPDAAAQKKADADIHEKFAAQFKDESREGRLALARTLTEATRDARTDAVRRFVLLKDARDAAASAGDYKLAFQAVEQLEAFYAVDGNSMRIDAVEATLPSLPPAQAVGATAEAMTLLDRLMSDDSDNAARLVKVLHSGLKAGAVETPAAKPEIARTPASAPPPPPPTIPAPAPAATPVARESADGEGFFDLFRGADLTRTLGVGQWERDGDAILLRNKERRGSGTLILPYTTEGSYEAQLRLTRLTVDRGGPTVIFPVGSSNVELSIGGGINKLFGLLRINDRDIKEGPATAYRNQVLRPQRPSTVTIRVMLHGDDADLTVTLDGEQLLQWNGAQSALSGIGRKPHKANIELRSGPSVRFSSLRLRMLSGDLLSKPVTEAELLARQPGRTTLPQTQPAHDVAGDHDAAPPVAHSTPPASAAAKEIAGKEGFVDLLRFAELKRNIGDGQWDREGDESVLYRMDRRGHHGIVILPYTTDGSYEVQLRLTRLTVDGAGPSIILPVGSSNVELLIGATFNNLFGLTSIDGKSAKEGPATTFLESVLTPQRLTTVDIRVMLHGPDAEITAKLDGDEIVHWNGPQKSLSGIGSIPQKSHLEIRGWRSVRYSSVRLHMLDGQLQNNPVTEADIHARNATEAASRHEK